MNFSFRKFFTTIFLLMGLTTAILIVKQYGLFNILYFYKKFDVFIVLGYLFTTFLIYLTLTLRWNTILKSMKYKVNFRKLFVYKIIGNAINFFTIGPRVGGELTQATLLENHKIKTHKGMSTIMIDKMVENTASIILFITGIFIVSLNYAIPENTALFLSLAAIITISIIGTFYYRMLNDKHFFLHIFQFFRLHKIKSKLFRKMERDTVRMEKIMIKFYQTDTKTFTKTLLLSLLSWILMFIEYKLLATLLGINLGFTELFLIITFIGLAIMIPMPMNVGSLEVGQVSAFSIIKIPASAGIALAFLVRIKDIIWGISGMILLAFYGFKLRNFSEEK